MQTLIANFKTSRSLSAA